MRIRFSLSSSRECIATFSGGECQVVDYLVPPRTVVEARRRKRRRCVVDFQDTREEWLTRRPLGKAASSSWDRGAMILFGGFTDRTVGCHRETIAKNERRYSARSRRRRVTKRLLWNEHKMEVLARYLRLSEAAGGKPWDSLSIPSNFTRSCSSIRLSGNSLRRL